MACYNLRIVDMFYNWEYEVFIIKILILFFRSWVIEMSLTNFEK